MSHALASWAEQDITPPLGLPMGGRGPRWTPGANVLDSLKAQVTVLQDVSGTRVVFVSLDLIMLGSDISARLKSALAVITHTPPSNIILNCSHTHSGPMTLMCDYATDRLKPPELAEYERTLLHKLETAAVKASSSMVPVEVFWCTSPCHAGINRRLMQNGEVHIAPNPQGPYIDKVVVILLQGLHGKATLFSYGCHPVLVYQFCWDGISADWPGQARMLISDELGPSTHVQFIQALAGNIRPRVLADLDGKRFRKTDPEDTKRVGAEVRDAVLGALSHTGQPISASFHCATGHILLPIEPGEPLAHWKALRDSDDELAHNLGTYWTKRLENFGAAPTCRVWAVGLVRLSPDHCVAWFAGEPFVEWLDQLHGVIPVKNLIAIGYCDASSGYLPQDHHLAEGGYEITAAPRMRIDGPGILTMGIDQRVLSAFKHLSTLC